MSQAGRFLLGSSGGAPIETLTGNTGGAIPPTGGNINIIGVGDISVDGNPATSTLEISLSASIADEYDTDAGTAVPALGVLNVLGSSNVHTSGSGNTITIALSDAIADEYDTDSGNAVPSLGILNILGGSNVDTSGAGNTVTISLGAAIADEYDTNAGTAIPALGVLNILGTGNISTSGSGNTVTANLSGITQHSLQVGGATNTLTQLGVATNGQIPIGSTGADPVLATLTAGTNISITNAAGSITIAATPDLDLNYTSVNTSPYVALSTDQFLGVDSSGAPITIELPNAPATGRVFIIKDATGSANTNAISVTTVGGAVNIDGATTYTMNTQYAAISVLFNGTSYLIY